MDEGKVICRSNIFVTTKTKSSSRSKYYKSVRDPNPLIGISPVE